MKLAISGHGRAGKDTCALWLARNTTLRYHASTSRVALPRAYEAFLGVGRVYESHEACYADRLNHREFWSSVIDRYNTPDPTRLYRDCLANQDVLTGIRKRAEMEAVVSAGMVDLTLWIDRPDVALDPTQEYGPGDCDVALLNDGDEAKLLGKLERLARSWGALK